VAAKSNYLFRKHPKIDTEDLPALPIELQEDFKEIPSLVVL
jgi:hypothetical protein